MPAIEQLLQALEDPTVLELMVNDDGSVYIETQASGLQKLPVLAAAQDAAALVKALTGESGFGSQRPYADLRGDDGSRVHVIAPPLVRQQLSVTIRKRPDRRMDLDQLVDAGTFTPGAAGFLRYAVENRKNVLVAGGTSSGKTTVLNALAAAAGADERILVIEDTPELTLPQPHVLYLRTRLRDAQGAPDVSLRDLLVNTLRMRPDRIVVGECRGPEAANLLESMNVGQEGVMATLHASSAREALQRLETLVLMSGIDLGLRAVRSNIATAVDLVIFLSRLADGSRRVLQISEITGLEVENITMADLFKTEPRKSAAGFVHELKPTGAMPRFYDQLRLQGHEPPLEFFK